MNIRWGVILLFVGGFVGLTGLGYFIYKQLDTTTSESSRIKRLKAKAKKTSQFLDEATAYTLINAEADKIKNNRLAEVRQQLQEYNANHHSNKSRGFDQQAVDMAIRELWNEGVLTSQEARQFGRARVKNWTATNSGY